MVSNLQQARNEINKKSKDFARGGVTTTDTIRPKQNLQNGTAMKKMRNEEVADICHEPNLFKHTKSSLTDLVTVLMRIFLGNIEKKQAVCSFFTTVETSNWLNL